MALQRVLCHKTRVNFKEKVVVNSVKNTTDRSNKIRGKPLGFSKEDSGDSQEQFQ